MNTVKRHPTMETFRRGLGQAIRNRRKALHLSQEQLAERLDLHRNYVSLVERGIQNITVETLFKLTEALDCSPNDLFSEAENLSDSPPAPARTPPDLDDSPIHLPAWRVAESNGQN